MLRSDQLTGESEVFPGHDAANADRGAGASVDGDGAEFSSDPMPAAYDVFYSAGIGLLVLIVIVSFAVF